MNKYIITRGLPVDEICAHIRDMERLMSFHTIRLDVYEVGSGLLLTRPLPDEYAAVVVDLDGNSRRVSAHRILCIHFIENPS